MEADVVKYIKEAQKHGLSDLEIKQNLLDVGWNAAEVEDNFAYVKAAETKLPVNVDEDIRLKSLPASDAAPAGQTAKVQAPAWHAEPQIIITEQHFKKSQNSKKLPLARILGILCLLAAIGGIGYYAYGYFYAEPQKAWDGFVSAMPPKNQSWNFVVDYMDSTPQNLPANREFLKDLRLRLEGSVYSSTEDPEKPVAQANVNIVAANTVAGSAKTAEIRRFGKAVYLKVSDWQFIKNLAPGNEAKWLKIDLGRLSSISGEGQETGSGKIREALVMEKYLGREKIEETEAFHYENSLDKQKLKNAISDFLAGGEGQGPQSLYELLDKMEIKSVETWLDTHTRQLLKIKLTGSAPSLGVFLAENNSWDVSGQALRNMQRIMDMQKYSEALKRYYREHGSYPQGSEGQPTGLVPEYMEQEPEAPLPSDGSCTQWYNNYWYTPTEPKNLSGGKTAYQSYEITFCLGGNSQNPSGIARLTPVGIEYAVFCNDTPEHCQRALPGIAEAPFAGSLTLEMAPSAAPVSTELTEPGQSLDLLKLIGGLQDGR